MKTKEELITPKDKVETINTKLTELTEKELAKVAGGDIGGTHDGCPYGKTKANKECNFVDRNRRCLYSTASELSEYVYTTYICEKGCGEFDNDLRDFLDT